MLPSQNKFASFWKVNSDVSLQKTWPGSTRKSTHLAESSFMQELSSFYRTSTASVSLCRRKHVGCKHWWRPCLKLVLRVCRFLYITLHACPCPTASLNMWAGPWMHRCVSMHLRVGARDSVFVCHCVRLLPVWDNSSSIRARGGGRRLQRHASGMWSGAACVSVEHTVLSCATAVKVL